MSVSHSVYACICANESCVCICQPVLIYKTFQRFHAAFSHPVTISNALVTECVSACSQQCRRSKCLFVCVCELFEHHTHEIYNMLCFFTRAIAFSHFQTLTQYFPSRDLCEMHGIHTNTHTHWDMSNRIFIHHVSVLCPSFTFFRAVSATAGAGAAAATTAALLRSTQSHGFSRKNTMAH